MAVTNASFRADFEEFAKAPDSVIDAALAEAMLMVNTDVVAGDDLADAAITHMTYYLASIRVGAEAVLAKGVAHLGMYDRIMGGIAAGPGVV